MALKDLSELGRLIPAQEAVIHKDTGELIAHGTRDQRGGHGAVDAAGEGADYPPGTYLGFDARDAFGDDVTGRPRSGAATDALEEVIDNSRALRRVDHLWMEHQAHVAAVISDGGDRAGRARQLAKALGQTRERVAMAHPHAQPLGKAGEDALTPNPSP